MAGMEQLEIHSKSYLVRWIEVSAGHTISWSVQPHKKSLNFGIFKHPGASSGLAPNLPPAAISDQPLTPGLDGPARPKGKSGSSNRNEQSTVVEKLQGIGLRPVAWVGKCEADKVSMGKYDVAEGEGGMYGLVFDNTFSKQVSKTVTFVLMTHPTNTPPKSGHHLHFSQASAGTSSTTISGKTNTALLGGSESSDSLAVDQLCTSKMNRAEQRPRSARSGVHEVKDAAGSTFFTGTLHKKRRKRGQGFARRFFSLDFTSSTLSYYQNDHSSALRGAIPLSLAAVGANEKTREISVDSGAEVWHLKARNMKDFDAWRAALEKASRPPGQVMSHIDSRTTNQVCPSRKIDPEEQGEWTRVEALVGRVSGIRDAVRRLAKDTDPKYLPTMAGLGIAKGSGGVSPSPSDADSTEYFKEEDKLPERIPFWKRKSSSSSASPSGLFRRSVSAQLAVPSPNLVPPIPSLPPIPSPISLPKRQHSHHAPLPQEEGMHDHCIALLRDLDNVVAEFSSLVVESRQRRMPPLQPSISRASIDSGSSEEFFDAMDGNAIHSQLLTIRRDSEEPEEKSDYSDGESETSEDSEDYGTFDRTPREGQSALFPTKPKSLMPLPLDKVSRRRTVPPPRVNPPSLVAFLRKNVGKDLSTIAMPVSANEPTSLLQRFAEQMEYSELLDSAVNSDAETGERLLYITTFAISSFSNSRIKERAIRKPFNPMLGETYELVREDKGFRFVAEKVSHRPVRIACQAEAQSWTFLHSPMPVQKFWGKSAELNTDGRARVFLHTLNEHYSWTLATSFLRNIIAGEKYVEPVSTMSVINESTGAKAIITFKAGGMFAGRSEDVSVQAFDPHGSPYPLGLVGKWTSQLNITSAGADTGRTLWQVGDLIDHAQRCYGFTAFAAGLNEITAIEDDRLPPTDSRLRPDQRAAEEGELDRAEALKARLEERQRARRKVMEDHGEEWTPRWFVKTGVEGDEEVWRLKNGKDGYWDERSRGEWTGVTDVFQQ